MDSVTIHDRPENGAISTCYCPSPLAINAMVFTSGTFHREPRADVLVPAVVPSADVSSTSGHRFYGIAVGASDHGYVAVAVSGICTVSCYHDDLKDAYPADLLECMFDEKVKIGAVGQFGTHTTCRLRPLKPKAIVDGSTTVGILLAYGRNPANEACIQILPGLHSLPQIPAPAVPTHGDDSDCDDDDATANMAVETDDTVDPFSMSIRDLTKVTIRNGSSISYQSDIARFKALIEEYFNDDKDEFIRAAQST